MASLEAQIATKLNKTNFSSKFEDAFRKKRMMEVLTIVISR